MADGPRNDAAPGQPSRSSILAALQADKTILSMMTTLLAAQGVSEIVYDDVDEGTDAELTYDALSHLVIAAINGNAVLPEQKVNIEYLKKDQRLVIPTGLGMSWTNSVIGRSTTSTRVKDIYLRATTMTYAEIKALVHPELDVARVREAVAARQNTARDQLFTGWNEETWYNVADTGIEELGVRDIVMAMFSGALQLNFDIRDYGYLNRDDATIGDSDWKDVSTVPFERLRTKLHAMTMRNIAALNYKAVGSFALAGWVRAYGLGIGIFPKANTVSVREYTFSPYHPAADDRKAIEEFEVKYEKPVVATCANILAMFGIFHLSKDHTYRSTDTNMERIGKSYIQTLRTDVNATTIEQITANQESIVRTAPHPFGLAQTYWLARVMAKYMRLMAPLAIRMDTTPPPVQRLMIADAAAKEWDGLPMGKLVSAAYGQELELIRKTKEMIKANPPAYSALHRQYGIAEQAVLGTEVDKAVSAMMAAVYGYIVTTHEDEQGGRDGLGYALSLNNIKRENQGNAGSWARAWDNYITNLDKFGLEAFVMQVAAEKGIPMPRMPSVAK